ncbi:MAG TPA: tRNA uridine-5-carboxymethylaminomethyl(34) synthesis GTPase MnmE, partial [Rhodothermales bacterium]|nr:tRNA uridine-5-carboxymethylaminomethyl(34) synthesis GTPase MnmE [Rhodothermales bacterium]
VLVLEALVAVGARLAAPGEFTQRAFLNGKLDLTQAEAVADLIHASARQAHRTALAHLRGDYARLLESLRAELLETASLVELELDFSDEDVEFADRSRLADLLARATDTVEELLGSYRFGQRVREGVRVAILGRPNAGKSTLLNALVGYDRAIVSPTPGTTRDEVEAEVELEGLRFRFTDTAGLRDTGDAIEAEGVRRARARAGTADLLIYVFDLALGLESDERVFVAAWIEGNPEGAAFVVGNKQDLASKASLPDVPGAEVLATAASESTGVAALAERLAEAGRRGATDAAHTVTNTRHRAHLAAALDALRRARVALAAGVSGDVLALDLRAALHELGAITGQVTTEDVLDQIFSRFCIGK